MAKFKCPDCNKKLLVKVEACPRCGRTFSEEEKKELVKEYSPILSIIVLFPLILICSLFICSFFVAMFSSIDSSKENTIDKDFGSSPVAADQKNEWVKPNIPARHATVGLQMTPTELMNKMNAFAKHWKIPIPIKTVVKTDSAPEALNAVYMADVSYKDVAILMETPKDSKNIIDVCVIFIPTSVENVLNGRIVFNTIIGALHPKMSAAQRGELISYLQQDLQNLDAANEVIDRSKVVNNIKHRYLFSQKTGTQFFSVSNVSDEQ